VDGAGGASGDVRLRWTPAVTVAAVENDIPTLPQWAAALLATGLFAAIARRARRASRT